VFFLGVVFTNLFIGIVIESFGRLQALQRHIGNKPPTERQFLSVLTNDDMEKQAEQLMKKKKEQEQPSGAPIAGRGRSRSRAFTNREQRRERTLAASMVASEQAAAAAPRQEKNPLLTKQHGGPTNPMTAENEQKLVSALSNRNVLLSNALLNRI
jgi:hypothetical protein